MKINLKKLVQDKEVLKHVRKEASDLPGSLIRKLDKVILLYDEIERDLEISGECIIELDKDRLEAIEERNKMLAFMKDGDDI